MITVPFPHLVLNSHNVPGEEYEMLYTWKVPESTSVTQMVDYIKTRAEICAETFEGKLETVIFNAHGKPGKIKIGHGITRNDVMNFDTLKGLVGKIWIVACDVAHIKKAATITDGNWFCYRLAQESGAYVKASSNTQNVPYPDLSPVIDFMPNGCIDDWEEPVFEWDPSGARC